MSSATVVFRCDASPTIGGGHVARCLGYAEAFAAAGYDVLLAVSNETNAFLRDDVRRLTVPEDAEAATDLLLRRLPTGAAILFVDHYGLGRDFETAMRRGAGKIAVIDDLHDRTHDCDALINTSAAARATDYAGAVPPGCRLLLGPAYAPLTPAYARLRDETLRRRATSTAVERVLVTFGLTDPVDATSRALAALRPVAPRHVDVVIGRHAPHLERVRAACAGWATLHVDAVTMPALMAAADLAIGAAGATSWERCCLGLPSVVVAIVDNQRGIAEALAAAGAALVVGPLEAASVEALRAALAALIADPARRRSMSEAAATLCDGRGAARTVEALAA